MSELMLKPKHALNTDAALSEHWNGFSIEEIADRRFWWLAAPQGAEATVSKLAEKHLGAALPDPGHSNAGVVKGKEVQIDWAGRGQWLVSTSLASVPKPLADKAMVTDQSDGWVGIVLRGDKTRLVLEKLCGLDTHPQVFKPGHCARVPIETMIALIACDDAEAGVYRLMFQRSSARSFVDHLRHAAYSTCGEKQSEAD